MKIALTSVSDIKNYGDILFPFVAKEEISKRIPDAEFRFFTPTDTILENEHFYKYSKQNIATYCPDIILTIGGEVIHKYDDLVWKAMYHGTVRTPSKVIFDWLDYPAFKGWFSVGVLDLGVPMKSITKAELSKLDFIGVRGILSKKILENNKICSMNPNIHIVPDIGWIFPRYFKDKQVQLTTLGKKIHLNLHPNNYIVFNINFTSISKNQIQKVLLTIDKFCARTQLKAVILEAISSYKSLHIDIKRFLQNNPNIKYISRLSINETGTLLMQARFFIGSSLHCAITSLASNKPAALIHISPLSKFQDLYGHIMMTEYLSNSWDDFIPLLHLLYDFNQHSLLNKYIQFMQSCFDNKMDLLIYKINNYIKNKTILENQII